MAVERVASRVRDGGHFVPEETIRRRYQGGLRNFFQLYQPIATAWEFWDNSSKSGPRLIASGEGERRITIADGETWGRLTSEYKS